MKRSAIIFICILCFHLAHAQIAFYDAKTLSEIFSRPLNDERFEQASSILAKYLSENQKKDSSLNSAKIQLAFSSNPFIPDGYKSYSLLAAPAVFSIGKALGFLGKTDVTTFADGAAKFIVERAREEFNIAFFQKLKKLSGKYPEFKTLFPRTEIFLTSFEPWDYSNILITLREAFDKDLKNLLLNVSKLNELNPSDCKDDKECSLRIAELKNFFGTDDGRIVRSVFHIANGYLSEEKIPDIIHTISGPDLLGMLSTASKGTKNSIKLVDILSYSVRSVEVDQSYIRLSQFISLMGNDRERNFYFALLYQQLSNANVEINSVNLANLLETNYTAFEEYISRLLKEGDEVLNAYQQIKEAIKNNEGGLGERWSFLFASANQFINHLYNIESIHPSFVLSEPVKNVLSESNRLLEIAHDVSVKNYNAAVLGVLSFISEKFPSGNDALNNFKKFFNKYGSFAANVVSATNSDEVKMAIKAVALPSGSASIKKNTHFNIALNSYLGGFYGNEYLANKKINKTQPVSGVTAPIGVNFSWQLNFPFKQGAISLFMPLIDVGAFASFRLKDSTTTDLPKVSLQNIFSPGLGLVYGIPKVPVSLGYVWQYGPALREINPTQATASENINYRGIFFLSIDIPLINFYNKTKTTSQ